MMPDNDSSPAEGHMAPEPRPTVSLGIPVYQGENYLRAALDSLLDQTFTDLEVVICDNASTDATEAICREYAAKDPRVRYHRQDFNVGAVKNYNDVFELSRGRYFKWVAHDDELDSRFVEACVEALDANPTDVLAYTLHEQIDQDGTLLAAGGDAPEFTEGDPAARLKLILDHHGSRSGQKVPYVIFGLIRRSALEQTRLHGFYTGSDRVLNAELTLQGRFAQVDKPLMRSREHPDRSISIAETDKQFHPREVWFAPDHAGKVVFPNWRRLEKFVTAVLRSRLSWREKGRCLGVILGWVARGNWKRLARDLGLGSIMLFRPDLRPR